MSEASKRPLVENAGPLAASELQRLIGRSSKSLPDLPGPDPSDSVHLLLQALPAALYMTDAAGRITFYNEAAVSLWGHRPNLGNAEWCGSWKLYWPDGTSLPHDECPMAIALKEGRAINGMEAAAERPDGTRVPFLAFPTPFFGSSGEVTGAVNMLVDISERKTAELAAEQLAAIVDSSDDAIISKDLDGIIKTWNRGAQRLFGYTEDEVIGKPVTILMPLDRYDEEPEILARIRSGERIDHYETMRQKKDGNLIDVSLCISPIKTPDGRVTGASKIARDITEQKQAEQFKDVLLKEMKHRVRNTLALSASICRQTFHSATDDEHSTFVSRIQALGSAHEILAKHSWEAAGLNEVVTKTMEPHRTGQGRVHIAGPELAISSEKAVSIALALHELATNAAKYGALSGPAGSVDIQWEAAGDDPDLVRLRWQERDGPTVRKPERKGFGSRLIERGLAAQFDAIALDFRPEGVTCTLEFSRAGAKDDQSR